MSPSSYGESLSDLVDMMARFSEREDIFRRNDIPKGHYYNVINPNRETSSGNPFYCPTEWGVKLTRDSGDFSWIKTVAKDCNGLFVSAEDIKDLNEIEPEKALRLLMRIVGVIKNTGPGA